MQFGCNFPIGENNHSNEERGEREGGGLIVLTCDIIFSVVIKV